MSIEPITVFARIADPAGVARRLREISERARFEGTDEDWRSAILTFSDSNGMDKRSITFIRNPAQTLEPNWSTQMNGMRGYLSGFPETERKARAVMLTTTFRCSLGTLMQPALDSKNDPRFGAVSAVAELLDGVLFLPSAICDPHGRILFGNGASGSEDPDAVWPKVIASVSVSEPLGAALHEESRPKPPETESESEAISKSEDEEASPPSPERVARRALALTALTVRAVLEQDSKNPNSTFNFKNLYARLRGKRRKPRIVEKYENLLAWVRDLKIDEEFEPEEAEVIETPLGRLDPNRQINATWRLESLVVLAWALGRSEIPPHDRLVTMNELWESLGFPDAKQAEELLARPSLRSRSEINTLRNRLFAIHWRLRNYTLRPVTMDFAEFAKACWFGPLDLTGVPLIQGDLGLRGERLDHVSRDAFAATHSASQERHQAANWLREGPERYSEASTAT